MTRRLWWSIGVVTTALAATAVSLSAQWRQPQELQGIYVDLKAQRVIVLDTVPAEWAICADFSSTHCISVGELRRRTP